MSTDRAPVTLLDCTLRDSGYAIDFQFSGRDTRNICRGLDTAGVRMIEIGHGLGLGATGTKHGFALESDDAYVAAALSGAPNAKLGAFFIPGIGAPDDIRRAADRGLRFIRVGNDPSKIMEAREPVELVKSLGLHASVNLMKSYAIPPRDLAQLLKPIQSWGADVIYVVDSAGCMLPNQVAEYVRVIREACPGVELGFHGHNNLCLANANALAAIDAGATYVDSTLRGMGRSAGNAQTEILAFLLRETGYDIAIDPFVLFDTIERHLKPLMLYAQGFEALDVVIGMSRFHSSHLPRFRRMLDRYEVDIRKLILEVSRIDCVNPPDDLIESVARDLSRREP